LLADDGERAQDVVARAMRQGRAHVARNEERAEIADERDRAMVEADIARSRRFGAAYKAAQARRAFLWSLVEADANRLTNGYDTGRPLYVVGSTEKIERAFEQVRQNAGAAFDSFAAKLVGKVGDCTAATLHCWGDVWTSSTLVVTKADGSVERWNTQRIINCSVLGKLFHQWPTRKAA
jgi:ParB-like chromosome segregation protein Spo0J